MTIGVAHVGEALSRERDYRFTGFKSSETSRPALHGRPRFINF